MSPTPGGTAALAAALLPGRAEELLARHPGVAPEEVRALAGLPRGERLARLGAALADERPRDAIGPGSAAGTVVRVPVAGEAGECGDAGPGLAAWPVLHDRDVLPLDLPVVAPALLQIDGALLELGRRVARIAASGLASVLGGEASIAGRLLPGLPAPAAATVIPVDLSAIAGVASIAVDRGFAARLAGQVACARAPVSPPPGLSAAERAVVELAILGALDAVAAETDVEAALAPRLALRGGVPSRPLCVEITVSVAGVRGRALVLLPEAAIRALRGSVAPNPAPPAVPIPASVRIGEGTLDPGEAGALGPGDVLLLDGPPGAASLLLEGRVAARGRLEGGSLEIEEVTARSPDGSVPVPVHVELGVASLPLGELGRIAPGAVLPLGLDRSGRAALHVGGVVIARGELVEVDGAVAFRVSAAEAAP